MPSDQVPRGQEKRQVKEPRPFRTKVFLYRMLAGIFIVEAFFLGFAFVKCAQSIERNPDATVAGKCPKIGDRAETLFIAAISTTLSLLTGAQNPRP